MAEKKETIKMMFLKFHSSFKLKSIALWDTVFHVVIVNILANACGFSMYSVSMLTMHTTYFRTRMSDVESVPAEFCRKFLFVY